MNSPRRIVTVCVMAFTLAGCGSWDRISAIGKVPPLNPIEAPHTVDGPITLPMPLPEAERPQGYAGSLWRPGAREFFKDQRASSVGDILTVLIDITDQAKVNNKTSRSRSSGEDANITGFLGLESQLNKVLPNAVTPEALTNFGSNSSSEGSGAVDRSESIQLTVAAIVTQVLPNGNLVVQGRQEVRVNFEIRELLIAGVVRPEDISADNAINHTQIAEARISYGGRGQISDMQQARYGQQLYDVIFPW